MVVIGGMRSFLGPALGALFFVIFRDYLSSLTENWLFLFGLLFVGFIVFSPTGLVGVVERLTGAVPQEGRRGRRDGRPRRSARRPLPDFLKPTTMPTAPILTRAASSRFRRHQGGAKA